MDEKCDYCSTEVATQLIVDSRGYEVALTCKECVKYYQRRVYDLSNVPDDAYDKV